MGRDLRVEWEEHVPVLRRGQHLAFNLLIFGAAACPLAVALPLGDQFALPKLAVAMFVAGSLLVLLPPAFMLRRWRSTPAAPLLTLGFLLALALSTLLADYPRTAVVGAYGNYSGVLYYLAGLLALVAAAGLVRTAARFERLVSVLAVGAIPVLAYALVQAAGLDPFAWDIDFDGRVFSTLGQPLVLGGYLAIMLPLLAWLAFVRRGGERLFLMTETTLAAALLVTTGTRGAWLAAAAAALVVGFLLTARACGLRRAAGYTFVVIVAVSGLVGALSASGSLPNRISSTHSISERIDLWRASIGMFADRPLLGSGPEHFALDYGRYRPSQERGPQEAYDSPSPTPHNETLSVLTATGLPGGVLYSVLWLGGVLAAAGLGLQRRLRSPRARAAIALVGALAAYLVQAQFSIPDPALFFIAMTLLGSAYGLSSRPRVGHRISFSLPKSLPVRAPLAAAGATLAFAAAVLIAADATYSRGSAATATGDGASIERLRLASKLNPLQPAYLDALAAAHTASARAGVQPSIARAEALAVYERRIRRFGGEASHHLLAAEQAALLLRDELVNRQPSATPVTRDQLQETMEAHLMAALAADPENPGLAEAVLRIEAASAASASDRGGTAR